MSDPLSELGQEDVTESEAGFTATKGDRGRERAAAGGETGADEDDDERTETSSGDASDGFLEDDISTLLD